MLLRSAAFASAVILTMFPAVFPALAADPPDAMKSCAVLTDANARLACYDKLAALSAAPAAAPVAAPVLPAAQVRPEQFGSEVLPMPTKAAADGAPVQEALEQISDEVKAVKYNPYGLFTVTLQNGQVWQQQQGDSDKARFQLFDSNGDPTRVTISRGVIGSYNLSVDGSNRVYKVRRVK